LVLTAALAAVFAFLIPIFIDRRDYALAVHNYAKNPTVDNAAVVAREKAKSQRVALITRIEVGGVLFALINVGWFFLARQPAPEHDSRPLDV
jgi:hypothetical protein